MKFIGIDCGRQTGWAEWEDRLDRFTKLETYDFWGAIDELSLVAAFNKLNDYETKVIIEDPGLNKPTFVPKGMPRNVALKKAQDVGRNKENAFLIIKYCEKYQIPFATLRPSAPKWNAETFKNLTKHQGRTNEHNRDAARLVWKLS